MNLNFIMLIVAVGCSVGHLYQILVGESKGQMKGWLMVNLLILFLAGFTYVSIPNAAGYVSFLVWFCLAFLPVCLFIISKRLMSKHNYKVSYYLALLCAILHPFDGGLDIPIYCQIGSLIHSGDKTKLSQMLVSLEKRRANKNVIAFCRATLYRLNYQWTTMLSYLDTEFENLDSLKQNGNLLNLYLRALGETRQLNRMVEILRIQPRFAVNYLVVCALVGKEDKVEALLTGQLNSYTTSQKNFWRLTVRQAAVAMQPEDSLEQRQEKLLQILRQSYNLELEENGQATLKWRLENPEFLLGEKGLTPQNEARLDRLFKMNVRIRTNQSMNKIK